MNGFVFVQQSHFPFRPNNNRKICEKCKKCNPASQQMKIRAGIVHCVRKEVRLIIRLERPVPRAYSMKEVFT